MDLRTNVLVKGSGARKVYQTIMNSAKDTPSNVNRRKTRLADFSKKIKESK
ncbi:MAG: hypothetical protein IJ688_05200 [Treponema sp.]|nr:hypothetical protein [Treponema sp.]